MNTKRPLILTEGNSKIGFGHITRCISLYQAFEKEKAKPELIVNGNKSVLALLKNKKYTIFNWLKEKGRLFEIIGGADIVVIDSYLADRVLYHEISKVFPEAVLAMIDDYRRINYPKGIVINPSIYGNKLNYPKKNSLVYLLGRDYIILRKELWEVPRKDINKKVKNILITLGGVSRPDLIYKLTSFLKKRFNFNYYIVDPKKNYLNAKEMLNLMLRCDICVSGGGQTTYELARVGVPTIGICFSKNQRLNLEYWHNKGFIEYAGWHNDKDLFKKLSKAVNKFMPYEGRKKRSNIGRDCVAGRGANRIVAILMWAVINRTDKQKELRLRLASKRDIYDLWKWRNHKDVRKWCFNRERIKYNTHKEWFEEKIKDDSEKLYIAENRKGEKIGHARFTIDGKKAAYINVNLNPRFFHKGFGSEVIKKTSGIFIRKNMGVKEVIAEIIEGNVASIKAFQKAGFIFSRNSFKNCKSIAIFKFKRTGHEY